MAADLDRAGRGSGGPAGRAGVIQAGREFLQVRGNIPAGLERILSFFVILLSFFDDLEIDY